MTLERYFDMTIHHSVKAVVVEDKPVESQKESTHGWWVEDVHFKFGNYAGSFPSLDQYQAFTLQLQGVKGYRETASPILKGADPERNTIMHLFHGESLVDLVKYFEGSPLVERK